jgi:D-psicose/D-tagatose/L-ribulose 3-epimerase
MKLAISNIAWLNEEEADVAELLRNLGVKYVEIAPTKKWGEPIHVSEDDIDSYRMFWSQYGIEVVAFQSILFAHPELKLFESESNRNATKEYLKDFVKLAGNMGAKRMVFGSPKNRQLGESSYEQAVEDAVPFFTEIADEASNNDVVFCIEPNAPQYNCDFVTNAQQGIDLVAVVSKPGFGLHLDIACMALAGDDITTSIKNAGSNVKHFHISSPMLEQVEERSDVDHKAAADALKSIDYDGFVSIEMRPGNPGEALERVKKAVLFAQKVYGV